jgi:maltose O-acetyltransferase
MSEQRHVNRLWNLTVNILAASPWLTGGTRERFYRSGGIEPNGTQIRTGCWFFSSKISFGHGGMVNADCYFENREVIEVGNNVFIGPQVLIGTSSHELGPANQRAGKYAGAPVVIGDGCWIGARVTILPGVTVAPGCVIAAGAVVTKSTEPHGLYAGVPAVRRREL